MPTAHGFQGVMGVQEEVTVGTPLAAVQKIPYRSESLKSQNNHVMDSSLAGPAARPISQQGTKIAEGGFEFHLRYTLQHLVLKHFFGQLDLDTPSSGINTYSLIPAIDGLSLTVAIDKQVAVWEHAGFKASELVISGSPTDGVIASVDGFFVSTDYASIINTTASLAALAQPSPIGLYQDVTIRIGDQLDALDSSDEYCPSSFEISINRGLSPTEVNKYDRLEALENAFRETTFTIEIPRYDDTSQQFITWHDDHTQLQAEIIMSDGVNSKTFRIPNMLVMEFDAEMSGPEFVTIPVSFTCHPDQAGDNAFMVLEDTRAEIELQES